MYGDDLEQWRQEGREIFQCAVAWEANKRRDGGGAGGDAQAHAEGPHPPEISFDLLFRIVDRRLSPVLAKAFRASVASTEKATEQTLKEDDFTRLWASFASSLSPQVKAAHKQHMRDYPPRVRLISLLRSGAIRLLSAEFLLALAGTDDGVLARRQELPEEAFVSSEEIAYDPINGVIGLWRRPGYKILSVSYPWLSLAHPDPVGYHLLDIASFIQWYSEFQQGGNIGAVFFDYGCIHQRPRTEEEEEVFSQILGGKEGGLDAFYGIEEFVCLQLHMRPPDFVMEFPEKFKKYEDRGWCFFEGSVAAAKGGKNVYHLSRGQEEIEAFSRQISPDLFVRSSLPMTALAMMKPPKEACVFLEKKTFTNGSDRPPVQLLYRRASENFCSRQHQIRVLDRGALQDCLSTLEFLEARGHECEVAEVSLDLPQNGQADEADELLEIFLIKLRTPFLQSLNFLRSHQLSLRCVEMLAGNGAHLRGLRQLGLGSPSLGGELFLKFASACEAAGKKNGQTEGGALFPVCVLITLGSSLSPWERTSTEGMSILSQTGAFPSLMRIQFLWSEKPDGEREGGVSSDFGEKARVLRETAKKEWSGWPVLSQVDVCGKNLLGSAEFGAALDDAERVRASLVSRFSSAAEALEAALRAERSFCPIQEIVRKEMGRDSLELALLSNNIGHAFWVTGRLQECLKYWQLTVDMRLTLLPSNHPEVADALNNLASVLFSLGDHEKSLSLRERAIAIFRKVPGQERKLAGYLSNLGKLYNERRQFQKARQCAEEAAHLVTRRLGARDPALLEVKSNLAIVLYDDGSLEECATVQEEVTELTQMLFGSQHPQLEKAFFNLALTRKLQGQRQEAAEAATQALKIATAFFGPSHPETENCRRLMR